jgi:glycine cleavage system H protein
MSTKTFPADLKYTKDHEWIQAKGDVVTVGITDHAQEALGEIVFLELPALGRELKKGETLGVVESIKAVSDIYSPVTGKVVEVHSSLTQEPGLLNSAPHTEGWLLRIQLTDKGSLDGLMDNKAYGDFVSSL